MPCQSLIQINAFLINFTIQLHFLIGIPNHQSLQDYFSIHSYCYCYKLIDQLLSYYSFQTFASQLLTSSYPYTMSPDQIQKAFERINILIYQMASCQKMGHEIQYDYHLPQATQIRVLQPLSKIFICFLLVNWYFCSVETKQINYFDFSFIQN